MPRCDLELPLTTIRQSWLLPSCSWMIRRHRLGLLGSFGRHRQRRGNQQRQMRLQKHETKRRDSQMTPNSLASLKTWRKGRLLSTLTLQHAERPILWSRQQPNLLSNSQARYFRRLHHMHNSLTLRSCSQVPSQNRLRRLVCSKMLDSSLALRPCSQMTSQNRVCHLAYLNKLDSRRTRGRVP